MRREILPESPSGRRSISNELVEVFTGRLIFFDKQTQTRCFGLRSRACVWDPNIHIVVPVYVDERIICLQSAPEFFSKQSANNLNGVGEVKLTPVLELQWPFLVIFEIHDC